VPVNPTQFAVILSGFLGFLRLQIIQESHIYRNIQQLLKLQILQKIQYKSKIYKNHRVKINIYKITCRKISDFKIQQQRKTLIPSFSCNSNLFIFSIAVFLIQIIINPLRRYRRRPAMYDGVPAQWQKPADQMRNRTDDAAYVFLGIFLAGLAVPAAFLIWAIATSLTSVFG